MNGIHQTLAILFGIGLLLFLIKPRQPKVAFTYLRYVILALTGVLMLTPFFWLIAAALKDGQVLMEYQFFPPIKWSASAKTAAPTGNGEAVHVDPRMTYFNKDTVNLKNFRELFRPKQTLRGKITFWRHLMNSLFYASTATILQLFFSSMGGYALAKYHFRGRKLVMYFMLASMMIPGIILLAPMYQLMFHLNWLDSYKALLIPGAVSVFGIFLFRQAILGVPDEIIEAGRVDGCGEFSIYLRLVMPLVRPMSAAFCLISFMGAWNAFIGPNIFLQAQDKLPLTVVLNMYIGEYSQDYGIFLAGTLIAIIPPAILFLALQKEFISGLTSGAIKG